MTVEELVTNKANVPTKKPMREGEFLEFLVLLTDEKQLPTPTAAQTNASVALLLNQAMGGATM